MDINGFYNSNIKPYMPPNTPNPQAIAGQIYALTGNSVTGGVIIHFDEAVRGIDVRDDIVKLAMLIRAYNDLVYAEAVDVPADAAARIAAIEEVVNPNGSIYLDDDKRIYIGSDTLIAKTGIQMAGPFSQGTGRSGGGFLAAGNDAKANGRMTVALGIASQAISDDTFALGYGTIANKSNQMAVGKYNDPTNTNALFMIGNGTSANSRSNAAVVEKDGDAIFAGKVYSETNKELAKKEYVDSSVNGVFSGNKTFNGNITATGNLEANSLSAGYSEVAFSSMTWGYILGELYKMVVQNNQLVYLPMATQKDAQNLYMTGSDNKLYEGVLKVDVNGKPVYEYHEFVPPTIHPFPDN